MAEVKKRPATAPIIDVAQPGSSAPSPNAKHVIVNHRPMAGDPMVTPTKIDVTDQSTNAELTGANGGAIQSVAEAKPLQPLLAPVPI